MKANEAPKKIYVKITHPISDEYTEMIAFEDGNGIEYTRTDVFIEKAVQYLKVHKEDVETEDNGIIGWIPDYFIEDFKIYMKGE